MTFDLDDIIDLNATEFIELHFDYDGNFDDASMGILTPVVGVPDTSDYNPTNEAGLSFQIVPSRM